MKVLGIDPGLATTGFAVIEKNASRTGLLDGLNVLEVGIIRTKPDQEMQQRLRILHDDIQELISEYSPDALAIEELFFNRNVTTAMAVSQARGVVLLAGSDIPQTSYTPLQIKKQICGFGTAKKPQIQQMVQQLLNINLSRVPNFDDAADALAVALCYLMQQRVGINTTSQMRSA